MSKKIIKWVCLLLPLAFIGLMTMQVMWIMEACELRDSQFDQVVLKCEEHVVSRLETDELIEYRPDKGVSTVQVQPFGSKQRPNKDLKDEISINFVLDNYGFYKLDAVRDGNILSTSAGVIDNRLIVESDIVPSSMTLLNDVLVRQIKSFKAKKNLSAFENRKIEERVNPQRLDALLMQQLADNGIEAPYEFAVFNSAGERAFASPSYAPGPDDKIYEKRLFPSDLHARAHYMRVYFPVRPQTISSLMALIVPTVAFFLVVIFLSVYSIWIIYSQKKLDDIKNDFIGNMTHEFKTPISTMSLAAQMLKDMAQNVPPSIIQRNTGIIIDEAKRLTIQVEKILQMASFDRGTARLKLVERDANEIIDKVINNFRVKVESENGEISGVLEADNPFVMVDEVHFTNVIYNLLDNAFKYRRDAPMIQVTTRNVKNGLVISISDNGIGISSENQKRIFDKFFRVSTGDRHDIKGFGLGLAYVRKIVADHGGDITVESELNVGTKFNIYIPVVE